MGTNYYVWINSEEQQWDDSITDLGLHIGKSSSGWVFNLRVYPDREINCLYDWLPILLDTQNVIRDEYSRQITASAMLRQIVCRSRPTPPQFSDRDMEINSAVMGPNNLLRIRNTVKGHAHGEGVWDYCAYEFC